MGAVSFVDLYRSLLRSTGLSMNALEMDRVSTVGVIGLIVFCFFGTIMGLLARMKGYSFLAWFGTGGTLLVSALALAFQPKLRGVELSAEELDRSRRRGNGIGWLIGVVNYMLVTFAALLPAIQNFARLEAKDYFQLYIVPAYNWADLAYMAGVVLSCCDLRLCPEAVAVPC